MAKFFLITSLLVLLVKIVSNGSCEGSGYEVAECLDRLSEQEIELDYHCCLLTGNPKSESHQSNQCVGVNHESYDNLDVIMNYYSDYYDSLSVDCKSYYCNIYLLYFLLILVLLI